MEALNFGLRALQLNSYSTATTRSLDQTCVTAHRPHDIPPTSYFRFYDLPPELRLRILETYVSTLYPRIVHRCMCDLCEPPSSTTLSSTPSLIHQRDLHGTGRLSSVGKGTKFRRRFSYCEDLPVNSNVRTLDHSGGKTFNFPYGTCTVPAEPGIFMVSKGLRQEVIDVMVKTRPLHMFTSDSYHVTVPNRNAQLLPVWYRKSVRFAEEFRPDISTISRLPVEWLRELRKLQEVRLNYGRMGMNRKMSFSREKLDWIPGVPRDLLEGMVRRRVWVLMRKTCIWSVRDDEEDQDLWLYKSKISALNHWNDWEWKRPPLERKWKVVLLVEFRVKVRENKHSKRKWASIVSHE